jgi:hypothetical protein
MSGSDRTMSHGTDPYTARTDEELAVEAEVHRRAEATVRRHEQDPTDLLQMLGLIEAPPSTARPGWQRKSRAKAKAVSE